VDISTVAWPPAIREEAVVLVLSLGLRIGIGADFLHIDVELNPYYPIRLWTYSGATSGD
jgi:hypothetical protein